MRYNHWEYTREQVEFMRHTLAESEWEGLRDTDLKEVLWDGCEGWKNIHPNQILEMYDNVWGLEDLRKD